MEIQTYEDAMAEVLDILKHTRKEDLVKISPKFMEILENNASKTYIPNLDHSKELKDMNLKPKTRALISIIYREFFCDENQKNEYDKKLAKYEIKYQEELKKLYNQDNLFKNKNQETTEQQQSIIVKENKKISFIKKLLNKIMRKDNKKF